MIALPQLVPYGAVLAMLGATWKFIGKKIIEGVQTDRAAFKKMAEQTDAMATNHAVHVEQYTAHLPQMAKDMKRAADAIEKLADAQTKLVIEQARIQGAIATQR
jgi:esterase/lipase